jgi:hypothetical protein
LVLPVGGRQIALKAPFPWFGGKSRVADLVWTRFGDTPNYVEPFAGSLAVLLGRPHEARIETVNDKDCFLANFWRALRANPEGVLEHCDLPVNEADLSARHAWLVRQKPAFAEKLQAEPDFYDEKIAGWWVWGLCSWIGSGFCSGEGPWTSDGEKLVKNAGRGVNRKLPHLGDAGRGINRQLPHLGDAGMGVNRQLPHLGDAGRGVNRGAQNLHAWLVALSERLRRVRVCCGDWERVVGPSPTEKNGITAVFLDPPYSAEAGREGGVYAEEDLSIAHKVREWAIANGDNPKLRIALCGYEGEHAIPDTWEKVAWKARGGYGSAGRGAGRSNANRERVWFSPRCLKPEQEEGLL